VLAFAAILLVVSLFSSGGTDRAVAWRDLTRQVGPLYIGHSERHLFRKLSKFTLFLGQAAARHGVPPVDFTSRQLLLLSPGPRSSTGYGVEVLSVRDDGGQITVRVRERYPHLGDHVSAHVTYPYRLISLPAGKDVFVDWLGR
jgi:hypothetical protein